MRFPYFQFYVNDFLVDAKVEAMATIEVGAYTLLLCRAWRETPPGTLPDDDKILARWSRLPDERWLEHKPYILAPFTKKDGKWHQKRMKEEFKKMLARFKERSETGREGASKRWGKTRENKGGNEDLQNDSLANGSAMAELDASYSCLIASDQIRSDHIPPNPQKGELFPEDKKQSPSPVMLKLGGLFHRRPTTVWSKNEIKALKALGQIEESDLALLERYYREKIPPDKDYRRKDLQTLLNNFNGEVDRARNHKPHKPF